MYQVLEDNRDFLVVIKQPEVSIHNESGEGLIEQLRKDLGIDTIVPVHRLDKATSGLLVCAKNAVCCSQLSQLFQARKVEKYYLALSNKKPSKKQGLIFGDMKRTRNGSWKLSKTKNKPAITQFFSYGLGNGKRLFILKPHTGKTHQLRVALKSLGASITGDKRYGSVDKESSMRMHLHAYILRFHYQGTDYSYRCLPKGDEFDKGVASFIEANLTTPWRLSWPPLSRINSQSSDITP